MGIDVKNREVFYNNTHQNGLNTSVDTNPHIMTVHKEIVVQSIFQRHKLDSGGDGNPFIYALKRSKYKISNKELLKFKPEFNIILGSVMQSKNGMCLLVPIPSSHKIASILARRASKIHNQCIVADIFSKKTNGEVASDLSQVKFSEDIKKEAIKLVSNLKRSKNATFTMKEVKSPKLRKHITPIKLHNKDIFHRLNYHQAEIILVDDLMSTGSTLIAACTELRNHGIANKISGLCLLSPL